MIMKQLIGNPATNNYLLMTFELKLRADSPHPCRMSWRIIKRNIVPWPMKIGVTSCPQSRSKMIGKGQQPKSIILLLLEQPLILTATVPLGSRGIIRTEMVSSTTPKDPTRRLLSITVTSAIACFSIMQECLCESICRIVLKTVLASVTTRRPSSIDWGTYGN